MLIRKTAFIFLISMLLVVSCVNKTRETNNAARTSEETDNTVIVRESVMGVINADCDYYSALKWGKAPIGRLTKGQEIEIGNYREHDAVESAIVVSFKTIDGAVHGIVHSRYVTRLDGISPSLWFHDVPLTREYYYTGTAEEIVNNDEVFEEGHDDVEKARRIQIRRAFFLESMCIMEISDDYIFTGRASGGGTGFKILSFEKDGNIYILQLASTWFDFELTIVDDGDGITITQSTLKRIEDQYDYDYRYYIAPALNYRYVPYDDAKSGKAKAAFSGWCDEQLELLASRSSLVMEFLNKVNERREMESRLRAEGAMLDGCP
jgi:hypothetical protein